MKLQRYYYKEGHRFALKGFAILTITLAICAWIIALLPLGAGIPLSGIAFLASVWPIVTAWSEAGRLYKKGDDAFWKAYLERRVK